MWQTTITPRFSDTDALRHISNIAIADWLENSRTEVFRLFVPDLDPNKWTLILASLNISFVGQLYYQYDARIETSVKKLGNSSFTIQQEIYQQDKQCVVSEAILVHFDHDEQRSKAIPEDIRAQLQQHML